MNQRGYELLLQTLAIKLFDERRNERDAAIPLEFYINNDELHFKTLADAGAKRFISRLKGIRSDAEHEYHRILDEDLIDWKNENHVRAVAAIAQAFQDSSFIRSSKTDLYQLVFYNFANEFKRDESAQFLTPLPVIDFLVRLVNPRRSDTVFDPCCGIGDFLSLAYVRSEERNPKNRLSDSNIFGVDVDRNMIMLASLNMLLNGDGEAPLIQQLGLGSISAKPALGSPIKMVDLIPEEHRDGDWDTWPDKTKLLHFDVILTNPPFGENRAFRPKNAHERGIAECYETWHLMRKPARGGTGGRRVSSSDSLDLGVIFLENAYRMLKPRGRFGIVLSNSIGSINKFRIVRDWLMTKMRLVAIFDLPPNVFAETGVNTTMVVAYKPDEAELCRLQKAPPYQVFARNIINVGYERRTSKRNVYFKSVWDLDPVSLDVKVDPDGVPLLKEDFTAILADFKAWAVSQEKTLRQLFVD